MDTSEDLFSKYSSYIGPNKLSKSYLDRVFMDSTDESSLINRCETGSKLSCSEAIAVDEKISCSFPAHMQNIDDLYCILILEDHQPVALDKRQTGEEAAISGNGDGISNWIHKLCIEATEGFVPEDDVDVLAFD
ncbi:hypothetical protein Tco_0855599 [Tanacetum coccineum]